ncbi:unnamed protein product [Prorocentrum cordatum]|uniref:C3H1-type domain-containing protein n=1 Tax=Prorocentrum cordatum TaxID=2364126 RepID=A0ABN9TJ21_9DINO|nr:unnamed protein product [Polarella glacialis]
MGSRFLLLRSAAASDRSAMSRGGYPVYPGHAAASLGDCVQQYGLPSAPPVSTAAARGAPAAASGSDAPLRSRAEAAPSRAHPNGRAAPGAAADWRGPSPHELQALGSPNGSGARGPQPAPRCGPREGDLHQSPRGGRGRAPEVDGHHDAPSGRASHPQRHLLDAFREPAPSWHPREGSLHQSSVSGHGHLAAADGGDASAADHTRSPYTAGGPDGVNEPAPWWDLRDGSLHQSPVSGHGRSLEGDGYYGAPRGYALHPPRHTPGGPLGVSEPAPSLHQSPVSGPWRPLEADVPYGVPGGCAQHPPRASPQWHGAQTRGQQRAAASSAAPAAGGDAPLCRMGSAALPGPPAPRLAGGAGRRGATGHAAGKCKPCAFHTSSIHVCLDGDACGFCHEKHTWSELRRMGWGKRKRDRIQVLLKSAGAGGTPGSWQAQPASPAGAALASEPQILTLSL